MMVRLHVQADETSGEGLGVAGPARTLQGREGHASDGPALLPRLRRRNIAVPTEYLF
jgi:hypothetical protein